MNLKNNRGYSMIEIGIGLLIITVFSVFSIGLFNGCYNNYHVIQARNIALKYAVNAMEGALQADNLSSLGFDSNMTNRSSILNAARSASTSDRAEGKYAVPDDSTENVEKNFSVTTKYRRVPTNSTTEAYDNTVLKVIVEVDYKIRTNDSNIRQLTLEALKVTK